jgi:hypothetical protein
MEEQQTQQHLHREYDTYLQFDRCCYLK